MSGPLEHAGVEDVLSSIRRLVSEDNRTARPSAPSRPEGRRPRLVLTPALRVAPADALSTDVAEAEAATAATPQGSSFNSNGVSVALDKNSFDDGQLGPVSDSGAKDDAETDDERAPTFLNGASNVEHAASLDMFRLRQQSQRIKDAAAGAAAAGADGAATQTDPWNDPEATLYDAADALDDSVEDTDRDGDAEVAVEDADHSADATAEGQHVSQDAAEVTQLHNASARHRAAAVVRKIAELEAAGSENVEAEVWEPDARNTGPFAASTRQSEVEAWDSEGSDSSDAEPVEDTATTDEPVSEMRVEDTIVDALLEDVVDATADEIEENVADAALSDVAVEEDAAVLDEDALREMVVDIVRSELQGALGEKITRNVRKLVRREIQRALAAHDLL